MKKILYVFFVLTFLFALQVSGQDSHLSQYFNVPLFVNPALAGNNIQNMRIAADYRSQWASSGSPYKTQTIALDKIVNHVGFGVMISKNSAGKDGFTKLNLLGGISYHKKFGGDELHEITAGFQVGLLQKSFDPNKLSFENQYSYDVGYDPNASSGETFANTKVSRPDINVGLTYFFGQGNAEIKLKPFAGISFSHINKPKESFIELDNVTPIKTTLHGGMGIVCSKKLELKPMVLFMKQDQFSELNAGVVSEFSLENTNTIKFGVFHRNKDAMIFYAGYQINKVLLGTSYDINTSAYNKASNGNGAFEISLVYTPQGKQAGKKIKKPEPKNTKPINKKKLPEQKLKRTDIINKANAVDSKTIEQKPNLVEPIKPTEQTTAKTQLPKNSEPTNTKDEIAFPVPVDDLNKKTETKAVVNENKIPVAGPETKKEINTSVAETKIATTEIKTTPAKVEPAIAEKTIIETPKQNATAISELAHAEFERLDFVLFTQYTTNYDINNKFDVVESVIDFLHKYPSSKILLAGNTDNVEQRIKPALGMLRANEVKTYMINHGVDASRIREVNTKDLNPLSTPQNNSPVDLNRRVDIFLVK